MAKKATKSGGKRAATKPKAEAAVRKSAAKRKSGSTAKVSPRKPARIKSAQPKQSRSTTKSTMSAGETLMKLMESPLVADLLAVGATAALAAVAGRGLGRSGGTSSTVKAAGKAAAAAMGRRLSTEVTEIRKASKARDGATD